MSGPRRDLIAHAEYQRLLDAVLSVPADDAPRLILADWLEDHGQVSRAELIRLQILGPANPTREGHLITRMRREQDWLWAVAGNATIMDRWFGYGLFSRGFIGAVRAPNGRLFLRDAAELFSQQLIEHVVLVDRTPFWGPVAKKAYWFSQAASATLESLSYPSALLPEPLFRALSDVPGNMGTGHDSVAEALDALSVACVAYGREQARLFRQEKGSPS